MRAIIEGSGIEAFEVGQIELASLKPTSGYWLAAHLENPNLPRVDVY
jgi:hypothetical protein